MEWDGCRMGRDAQVAAMCRVHACTLATRNVRDFEGSGVTTVNPWNDDDG